MRLTDLSAFDARAKSRGAIKPNPLKPKYGNRKVTLDGHKFDSRAEAARYAVLAAMQKAGEISELRMQIPFVIIPKQRDANGSAVRECRYVADFVYMAGDRVVVEDVKGMLTPEYRIKKKLMLSVWNITVQEIGGKAKKARQQGELRR
jgi:hypothetical protein